MSFAQPLLLLALVPLGWGTIAVGRARLRRLPWLRALITLILRLAIVVLLVTALAGPRATMAAAGVNVVFVVDRSASSGTEAQRSAAAWISAALRGMSADDRASVVAYGATASWSGQIANGKLPVFPAVGQDGTNIAAALRLALSGVPPDRPSRIVLLSDGRQTSGDAAQVAQQAAVRGIPISVVPLSTPAVNDVAITGIDLPPYTRAGDHSTLRVTLQASRPERVQLSLSLNGAPAGAQSLTVQAGANTFLFAQTMSMRPGVQRYRLQVQAPQDAVPQNNVLDASTVVEAAPKVLVLAGDTAEAAPLVGTLQRAGLQVSLVAAAHAPTDSASLATYDAVVLADAPASSLPAPTIAALHTVIYEQGHGLLVTGGLHSFAAGGYAASPLQRLLPVTSEAQASAGRGSVGLILLIDKSGSMMDAVQGVSKISMAQQAAIDAIQHLQPDDEFGVLAFDDNNHTVVPFGPVGTRQDQGQTRASILALQPFGDTVIYPALLQAARWLFASHLPFKHVVLMTDGQGEAAAYLPLIKKMRQNNITLSTIAIGADAEVDELRSWATAGGGRFYYTADPRDIPRLVVLETRLSSGPSRVQGVISVHQATAASALRSLAGQALQPINSYNITAPRATTEVVLQSALGDPLLAQWQYGLGRVAVWTAGTDASWARSWLGQRDFWSDTLRWTMAAPAPQTLRPDLSFGDGVLHIGVDARTPQGNFINLVTTRAEITGPDGTMQTVPLLQDAPGHYGAAIAAHTPGVYAVQLDQFDGATELQRTTGAVTVPYSPEYLPGGSDLDLLTAIAAADTAPSLQRPGDAFSASGLPPIQVSRDVWPLLALFALLLFPLDVAVRMLYTPQAPYDPARFTS
ncbi:MAG TPA: VWA domain-containing protein [Chloroflexota bacterium]|nr:VWA domain-containing protein [Chloroflexota bacterium]